MSRNTERSIVLFVCLKWRQTLGSRSPSWLARRFVQVASRDMWKLKAFAKICGLGQREIYVCLGIARPEKRKKRKSQWSHGKPPKPPLHQILLLCCQPFLFCATRIAALDRSDRRWRLSCKLKKEVCNVVAKATMGQKDPLWNSVAQSGDKALFSA